MKENNAIVNGVPWFDQNGEPVNAHAGCIIKEDLFYLFGEYKTNDENKFIGFSRYSSLDLVNWTFEGLALSPQLEGLLGPDRIGERVKVLKCPKTGKYIMFMHTDDLTYTDPHIGVAISDRIDGEFKFLGPLRYRGEPIKRWDMGTYLDVNGKGYLLIHEGDIYRLSEDFLEAEELVASQISPGGESPTMFRKDEYYYLMFSNKTSWEKNDNYYYTATDVRGPWKPKGIFCPRKSLTYNSQCSSVFEINNQKQKVYMYMGDRWSFPKQATCATQVWLPLRVQEEILSIPEYISAWIPETVTPTKIEASAPFSFTSNRKEESTDIHFIGKRIYLFGHTRSDGGYARIQLFNEQNECVHESEIDFYSMNESHGIRYQSPKLIHGAYTLRLINMGENGTWTDKTGYLYGSKGCQVNIEGYYVI